MAAAALNNIRSLVLQEIANYPGGSQLSVAEQDNLVAMVEARVAAMSSTMASNQALVMSVISHEVATKVNQLLISRTSPTAAAPSASAASSSNATVMQTAGGSSGSTSSTQLPTPGGIGGPAGNNAFFNGLFEQFGENIKEAKGFIQVLGDLNQATMFLQRTFGALIGPFMGAVNLVERFNEQMIQSQISYIIATNRVDELGVEVTDFATRMESSRVSFQNLIEELEIETQTIVGLTSARLNNVLGNIIQESGKILPQYTEKSASTDEEFFKKLTGNLSATLSLLKMPEFQDRQEIRALLMGNVNDPNAVMAQKLGISRAEVDKAKSQGTYGDLLLQKTQPFREASTLASGSLTNITSNVQELLEQVQREFGAPILKQFTKIGEQVFSSINSGPAEAQASTRLSVNKAVLQIDRDLERERRKLDITTLSQPQRDDVERNINRLGQARESIISTAATKLNGVEPEIFQGSFEERETQVALQGKKDADAANTSILDNLKAAAEEVGIVFGQVVESVYGFVSLLAEAFQTIGGVAALDGVLRGFFGTVSLVSKVLGVLTGFLQSILQILEPFKSVLSPFMALAGIVTGSTAAVVAAVSTVVLSIRTATGALNLLAATAGKVAGATGLMGGAKNAVEAAAYLRGLKGTAGGIFRQTVANSDRAIYGMARVGRGTKQVASSLGGAAMAPVNMVMKPLQENLSKAAAAAKNFASGGSLFGGAAATAAPAISSLGVSIGVIGGVVAAGAAIGVGVVQLWKNGLPALATGLSQFITANQGALRFLNFFAEGLRNGIDSLISFGDFLANYGDWLYNVYFGNAARTAGQQKEEMTQIADRTVEAVEREAVSRGNRVREIAKEGGLVRENATSRERFNYAINSGGLSIESEVDMRKTYRRQNELLKAIASGDQKAIREKSGGELDGISFSKEQRARAAIAAEALATEFTAMTGDKIDGETKPLKRVSAGEFGSEARAQISSGLETFASTERTLSTDIETRKNLKESMTGGIERLIKGGVIGRNEIDEYIVGLNGVLSNIGLEEQERMEFLDLYNKLIDKELEITKSWAETTKKLSDARFKSGQITEAENKRDKAAADVMIAEGEFTKGLKSSRELVQSSSTAILQNKTLLEVEALRAKEGELESGRMTYGELSRERERLLSVEKVKGNSFSFEDLGVEIDAAAIAAGKGGVDFEQERVGIVSNLKSQYEFFEAARKFEEKSTEEAGGKKSGPIIPQISIIPKSLELEKSLNVAGSFQREVLKQLLFSNEKFKELRERLQLVSEENFAVRKFSGPEIQDIAKVIRSNFLESRFREESFESRINKFGGKDRVIVEKLILENEKFAGIRKKYKGVENSEVIRSREFSNAEAFEISQVIKANKELSELFVEKTFSQKINERGSAERATFKELLFKDDRLVELREKLGVRNEAEFDSRQFKAGEVVEISKQIAKNTEYKFGKKVNESLFSEEAIADINTKLANSKDIVDTLVLSVDVPEGEVSEVREKINKELASLDPKDEKVAGLKLQLESLNELEKVRGEIARDKSKLAEIFKGGSEPLSESEVADASRLKKQIEFNEARLKNSYSERTERIGKIEEDQANERELRISKLSELSAVLAAERKILQNEEIRLKNNRELSELLLKQLNAAEALASVELDAAISFSPELYQADVAEAKQEGALSKFLNKREELDIVEEQSRVGRFSTTSSLFKDATMLKSESEQAEFLNKGLKRNDIEEAGVSKYVKEAKSRAEVLEKLFKEEVTLSSVRKAAKSVNLDVDEKDITEKNYKEVATRMSEAGGAIIQGGEIASRGIEIVGLERDIETKAVAYEEASARAKELGIDLKGVKNEQQLLSRLAVEYSEVVGSQENIKAREEVSKATQEAIIAEKEYVVAIDETIAALAKVEAEINKRLTREIRIDLQLGEIGLGSLPQLTEYERNIQKSLMDFEDAKTELQSFEKYFTKEQFVELADGNISPERLRQLGETAGLNEMQFSKLSAAIGALSKVFETLYNETAKYFDLLISVQKLQDKFAELGVGPMATLSKEQRALNVAMSEYDTSISKVAAYELSKTMPLPGADGLVDESGKQRKWNFLDPKYIELVKNAAEAALNAIDASIKRVVANGERYNNVLSKTLEVYSKMSSNANIFGEISSDYGKIAATAAEKAGFNEEATFLELSPEQRRNYVADEGILDFKKKQEEIEKQQEIIAKKRELIEIKILQLKNRQLQIEQKMERAKILGDTSLDANTKRQLLAINSQMQVVVGEEGNLLRGQEYEKLNVLELLRRQQNKELLSPKELQFLQQEGLRRQEANLDDIFAGLSGSVEEVEQDGFVEAMETDVVELEGEIAAIVDKLPTEALDKISSAANAEVATNTSLMAGYLADIKDLLANRKEGTTRELELKSGESSVSSTEELLIKYAKAKSKPMTEKLDGDDSTITMQRGGASGSGVGGGSGGKVIFAPTPALSPTLKMESSGSSGKSESDGSLEISLTPNGVLGAKPTENPYEILNWREIPAVPNRASGAKPMESPYEISAGVSVPNTWRRMRNQKSYKIYDANGALRDEIDPNRFLPGNRSWSRPPSQFQPQSQSFTSRDLYSQLMFDERNSEFMKNDRAREFTEKFLSSVSKQTQQTQQKLLLQSQLQPQSQSQPQSQPQTWSSVPRDLYSQLMFDERNSEFMKNDRAREFTEKFLSNQSERESESSVREAWVMPPREPQSPSPQPQPLKNKISQQTPQAPQILQSQLQSTERIAERIEKVTLQAAPVQSLYSQLMFDERNSEFMKNDRAREFTEKFLSNAGERSNVFQPSAAATTTATTTTVAQSVVAAIIPTLAVSRLPKVENLREIGIDLQSSPEVIKNRELIRQQKEIFSGKSEKPDLSIVAKLERGLSLLEEINSNTERKQDVKIEIPAPGKTSVLSSTEAKNLFSGGSGGGSSAFEFEAAGSKEILLEILKTLRDGLIDNEEIAKNLFSGGSDGGSSAFEFEAAGSKEILLEILKTLRDGFIDNEEIADNSVQVPASAPTLAQSSSSSTAVTNVNETVPLVSEVSGNGLDAIIMEIRSVIEAIRSLEMDPQIFFEPQINVEVGGGDSGQSGVSSTPVVPYVEPNINLSAIIAAQNQANSNRLF